MTKFHKSITDVIKGSNSMYSINILIIINLEVNTIIKYNNSQII